MPRSAFDLIAASWSLDRLRATSISPFSSSRRWEAGSATWRTMTRLFLGAPLYQLALASSAYCSLGRSARTLVCPGAGRVQVQPFVAEVTFLDVGLDKLGVDYARDTRSQAVEEECRREGFETVITTVEGSVARTFSSTFSLVSPNCSKMKPGDLFSVTARWKE